MKVSHILFLLLALVLSVSCTKHVEKPRGKYVDPRQEALKQQQDAMFKDRYGSIDAMRDLEAGTPKLLWYGLYREDDAELKAILLARFKVRAEPIAGCEASAGLVNYADSYNATILKEISKLYGQNAYAQACSDAREAFLKHSPNAANKPVEVTPTAVTPAADAPVAPSAGAPHH